MRRCCSTLRHCRTASSSRQYESDRIFPGCVRLSKRSIEMKPSIANEANDGHGAAFGFPDAVENIRLRSVHGSANIRTMYLTKATTHDKLPADRPVSVGTPYLARLRGFFLATAGRGAGGEFRNRRAMSSAVNGD